MKEGNHNHSLHYYLPTYLHYLFVAGVRRPEYPVQPTEQRVPSPFSYGKRKRARGQNTWVLHLNFLKGDPCIYSLSLSSIIPIACNKHIPSVTFLRKNKEICSNLITYSLGSFCTWHVSGDKVFDSLRVILCISHRPTLPWVPDERIEAYRFSLPSLLHLLLRFPLTSNAPS